MLERFTFREDELNRLECDGIVRVIGIFRDQAGKFASFDELFEECTTKLIDLLFSLNHKLFQVLAA